MNTVEIVDESPVDATSADVIARLIDLIGRQVPTARDIAIHGVRRTSGGFSRENWIFDATWTDRDGAQSRPMILRRDPLSSFLDTDRDTEFALLHALEQTDVPAPRVYWLDGEGQALGRPSVVMERMSGECDWMVLNSDRPLDVRLDIARDYLDVLARIHNVDWKALGLDSVLEHAGESAAFTELRRWGAELDKVRLEPLPEMVLTEKWLRAHAPRTRDIVLVHGDYKPGNALVEGRGLTAMLDWETAHLGDPLEDLGWITNPVRKREQQIAGEWERAQIIAAYQRSTGREINEADLLWWNIFCTWRLSVTTLVGLHGFVAGTSDRISQTPTWLFRRMFQLIEEWENLP
ncbi:phosphotransferase family protein [Rhodococcus opacus]|uniref:phosphotransferase family protein n=1 Tax=Rhodococcus opacus TaxID=37919 RepID=UPI001C47F1DF|nr:phosphotransferase family protein [Rhodococcus opacus]MBV6756703.1 phosphotransferase family protein [Rhodococcus opacus]